MPLVSRIATRADAALCAADGARCVLRPGEGAGWAHWLETSLLCVSVEEVGGGTGDAPSTPRFLGTLMVNDTLEGVNVEHVIKQLQSLLQASVIVTLGNAVVTTGFVLAPDVSDALAVDVLHCALTHAARTLPEADHFLAFPLTSQPQASWDCLTVTHFSHCTLVHTVGAHVIIGARSTVLPDLLVRAARVEDHDDLVPIFQSRSGVVRDTFGDYFLAGIIERQNEKSKVLVGEGRHGTAVGLMALSNEVDVNMLAACFDLSAFGGLRKRSALQAFVEQRSALVTARARRDWLTQLQAHVEELALLFDSIMTPSGEAEAEADASADATDADDTVKLRTLCAVLDAKGDAWGYVGAGGLRMGAAMLNDIGYPAWTSASGTNVAPEPTIARQVLNAAVTEFGARRERTVRRRRMMEWYGATPDAWSANPATTVIPPGRRLVLEEYDRLASAVAAAVAAAAAAEAERRAQEVGDASVSAGSSVAAAGGAAPSGVGSAAASAAAAASGGKDASAAGGGGAFASVFKQARAAAAARRSSINESRRSSTSGAASGLLVDRSPRVPLADLVEAVNARLQREGLKSLFAPGDNASTHVRIQMSAAAEAPPVAPVGERITTHGPVDGVANLAQEKASSAPGTEFFADLVPWLRNFGQLISALGPSVAPPTGAQQLISLPGTGADAGASGTVSARASVGGEGSARLPAAPAFAPGATAEEVPWEATQVTRMLLLHALEAWERDVLPPVLAPRIFITSSGTVDAPLAPPATGSEVRPSTEALKAAGEEAARLLGVPVVDFHTALWDCHVQHVAAVEAAAAAAAAAAEEAERARKDAEEAAAKKSKKAAAAAKAAAAGGAPAAGTTAGGRSSMTGATGAAAVAAERKAAGEGSKEATAHAHAAAPGTAAPAATAQPQAATTIDPADDPLGALTQYLMQAKYSRGFVLIGLPVHDDAIARRVAEGFANADLRATMSVHLMDEVHTSPTHRAHGGSHAGGGAHDPIKLLHRPSERFLLHAVSVMEERARPSKVVANPLPAGYLAYGYSAVMEGTPARAAAIFPEDTGNLLGIGREGGASTRRSVDVRGGDGALLVAALREQLLSTLLVEGLLTHDPDDERIAAKKRELKTGGMKGVQSNAFSITLYCMAQDAESRFTDLLAGAFEAYPDREYCIISQSHRAPDMRLLSRFLQVAPLSPSDQTLYVCHRDSLASPALLSVRLATPADRGHLLQLVHQLPDAHVFMDAIVAAEEEVARFGPPLSDSALISAQDVGKRLSRLATYVAVIDNQIIGVCVLSLVGTGSAAVDAAAQSFELQRFIEPKLFVPVAADAAPDASAAQSTFASLLHIVMNPCFYTSMPHYLRQCMRLFYNRQGVLYRQTTSPVLGAHISAPLPPVVKQSFLLVAPRSLMELTPAARAQHEAERRRVVAAIHALQNEYESPPGVIAALTCVAGLPDAFLADPRLCDHSLYMYVPALSHTPLPSVNTRVVIVGASDAALACVSSLLYKAKLNMPHITLVSAGGLPSPFDYAAIPAPFVSAREFTAFELSRMPLSSFVRVIDDVVVGISRAEKRIMLGEGAIVPYDYLVLLPGLTEGTWPQLGYSAPEDCPPGMFSVLHANALFALANAVETMQEHYRTRSASTHRPVVVYGDGLDAIVAVNALLSRGLPGSEIVFVQPARPITRGDDANHVSGAPVAASATASVAGNSGTATASAETAASAMLAGDAAKLPAELSTTPAAGKMPLLRALAPAPPIPITPASNFASGVVHAAMAAAGVRMMTGFELARVVNIPRDPEYYAKLAASGGIAPPMPILAPKPRKGDGKEADDVDEDVPSDEEEDEIAPDGRPVQRGVPMPPLLNLTFRQRMEDEESGAVDDKPGIKGVRQGSGGGVATGGGVQSFNAHLLICADRRDVDPRFFTAANDSGIVYDGRLVVDHEFHATDPYIFGGGSVAKFSRRYRAVAPLQAYDSREVGSQVCEALLRVLDPSAAPAPSPAVNTGGAAPGKAQVASADLHALLPKFTRPKAVRALLPGNLHFLRAQLPEVELGGASRELVTHVPSSGEGASSVLPARMVRCVLDRLGYVAEIEYIGQEPVEMGNLTKVVGLHQSTLNGLVRKYDAGAVPDIITFLRAEWSAALMHDRFGSLMSTLSAELEEDPHVQDLLEGVRQIMATSKPGSTAGADIIALAQQRVGVLGGMLPMATRRIVEARVLEFLRDQRRILTGYYVPPSRTPLHAKLSSRTGLGLAKPAAGPAVGAFGSSTASRHAAAAAAGATPAA